MRKFLGRAVLALMLTCGLGVTAFSQKEKPDASLACNDNIQNGRLAGYCEMKEQTLPATAETITVDGRVNGGIAIKGWKRNEILVRSRIQTASPTAAEAKDLAGQIRLETAGSRIFATGPDSRNDRWWSVSYEIFVPLRSNLSLKTTNGGISIVDVNGRLTFNALNGGVHLKRVGGNVRGGTTNGGLAVELSGNRWDGEALDVTTTNGGVSLLIPENYSAHLETGTVNGRVKVDFPVTVQGNISRELSVNLGSGGPTIKAMTTNGGVSIRHGEGLQF
jgi:hypothetical protein